MLQFDSRTSAERLEKMLMKLALYYPILEMKLEIDDMFQCLVVNE